MINQDTIIFCCNDYVVADKPAGVVSEIADEASFPLLLGELLGGEIYPVHRLDKNVSGVMVYARNKKTAARLSQSLANGEFEKHYTAVVHGRLEPSEGSMKDLLYKSTKNNKSYVVDRKRRGVKEAELTYKVTQYTNVNGFDASEVDIHLLTGRHHQIRVQFASRKHPLFGDRRYGAPKDGEKDIALRCYRLSFPDDDGSPLCYEKR